MQTIKRTALLGAAIIFAGCSDAGRLVTGPVAENVAMKDAAGWRDVARRD